jgi:hypothetical protein
MGRDLSAQEVHAQLAEWQWPELLNLRWYGGFDPLGYSVLSPPIMAVLGIRLTTALAYVVSVVLFAALLKRAAVARPVLGAITVAVCLTGNLVTARTTFELGLVLGLGALLVLSYRRLRIIVVLVVLAALTSPIAGLFLGVAGGALFLAGRRRDGLIVGISAMVPTVAVGVLFCNGGHQSVRRRTRLTELPDLPSRRGPLLAHSRCPVGCAVVCRGWSLGRISCPRLSVPMRRACPSCLLHQ